MCHHTKLLQVIDYIPGAVYYIPVTYFITSSLYLLSYFTFSPKILLKGSLLIKVPTDELKAKAYYITSCN